jgi:hypothetical protein
MSIEDRLWLPCCIEPSGSDTRRWLANASDENVANQRSPSGLPQQIDLRTLQAETFQTRMQTSVGNFANFIKNSNAWA